jgi:putative FmdB family regulatory protein
LLRAFLLLGRSSGLIVYPIQVPIFEFRCQDCQNKFSTLVGMVAGAGDANCPKCGSSKTDKLVSRVAKFRTEEGRIDEIADRLEGMDEPESGSEMRSILRELGKAADDDVSEDMEDLFEADMEGRLEDE